MVAEMREGGGSIPGSDGFLKTKMYQGKAKGMVEIIQKFAVNKGIKLDQLQVNTLRL